MEFNFCRFPDDEFHTFGFPVQDIGVMKLHAVTQVYTVLG